MSGEETFCGFIGRTAYFRYPLDFNLFVPLPDDLHYTPTAYGLAAWYAEGAIGPLAGQKDVWPIPLDTLIVGFSQGGYVYIAVSLVPIDPFRDQENIEPFYLGTVRKIVRAVVMEEGRGAEKKVCMKEVNDG